jgi:hypothetical protein
MNLLRTALALAWGSLLVAGCGLPASDEDACQNYCACKSSPLFQESVCVPACIEALDQPIAFREVCVDCLADATCAELDDDDHCLCPPFEGV